MVAIKNIKKAMVIAEEWLNNGGLPSTWDDLYEHIISQTSDISGEKTSCTGWIAFVLLTKYNDVGDEVLSIFDTAS